MSSSNEVGGFFQISATSKFTKSRFEVVKSTCVFYPNHDQELELLGFLVPSTMEAKPLIGLFIIVTRREVPLEELVDLDSLDFGSLDDSTSLLDFLLFVHRFITKGSLDLYLVVTIPFSTSFSKLVTLSLNLNMNEKYGSAGNEVVTSEAVGVGVGVGLFKGLNEEEAISLSVGEAFSKFRSLLVKSDETEELCIGPSVFYVSWTTVSVTCASSSTCLNPGS
ncbi:hypothetical protein Tco_0277631 [Tanacetum coccineum]